LNLCLLGVWGLRPNRLFCSELRGGYDEAVRPDEREGSAMDQKGKEEDQGLIVLATRKLRVSNRTLVLRLKRTAARTSWLSLRQEPPRTTR
jgi:hypothetical protein